MSTIERTRGMLMKVMRLNETRTYASPDGQGEVHVFSMGAGGAAAELHVAVQSGLPAAQQGAGGVHHAAIS